MVKIRIPLLTTAEGVCGHAAVWAAIDEVAARCDLSESRLAIMSGYDPTSFNKSKRRTKGELWWQSMETVAKVLLTAEMTFEEFGTLVDGQIGQ